MVHQFEPTITPVPRPTSTSSLLPWRTPPSSIRGWSGMRRDWIRHRRVREPWRPAPLARFPRCHGAAHQPMGAMDRPRPVRTLGRWLTLDRRRGWTTSTWTSRAGRATPRLSAVTTPRPRRFAIFASVACVVVHAPPVGGFAFDGCISIVLGHLISETIGVAGVADWGAAEDFNVAPTNQVS